MIKAVIVDDERAARVALQSILEVYFEEEIKVVGQAASVPEAVLAINKHNPDVVFLDIEMPEYSGLELVDFFKSVDFEIIFVTAYSQYAAQAAEMSAVDYLLKPLDIDDLRAAVTKLQERRRGQGMLQRMEIFRSAYKNEELRRVALPMLDGLHFVEIAEIVLFEAERAYTTVHLQGGGKITVSKPMRTFEDLLAGRPYFFRPHRSFLVNLNHLQRYVRGESMLVLDSGLQLALARDRKQDFEQKLRELHIAL